MSPPDQDHDHWPADRFYWAVVDGQGWDRPGLVPPGLRGTLGEEFPEPIDTLHIIAEPFEGRLLICAARRADLGSVRSLSLSPDDLPPFAPQGIDPDHLNLLIGEFEPRPIRRARARAHLIAAAALLACSAILSTGLARRGAHWNAHARGADLARESIVLGALGGNGGGGGGGGGSEDGAGMVDLRTEVDALRATLGAPSSPITDAAADFAALLRGWPTQEPCTIHSIRMGADGASLSLHLEGDPAAFLRSLEPPPGWAADEPRLTSTGDGTRLSLRVRPGAAP